jgi:hypothetical protein
VLLVPTETSTCISFNANDGSKQAPSEKSYRSTITLGWYPLPGDTSTRIFDVWLRACAHERRRFCDLLVCQDHEVAWQICGSKMCGRLPLDPENKLGHLTSMIYSFCSKFLLTLGAKTSAFKTVKKASTASHLSDCQILPETLIVGRFDR